MAGPADDVIELARLIQQAEGSKGCGCPCHRGRQGIFHVMPCHPGGYEPPKTTCGGFGADPAN